MREAVRGALNDIAARFSDDAPSIDERVLRRRYGALDAWPVDAELGLCVLAWALGSGFSLGGFRDAVSRLVPDFEGASRAIEFKVETSTLVTLSGIARSAFRNGNLVVRWNLDPDTLYWPQDLSSCQV